MRLSHDWRRVLRRAWSVRLMALAILLTAAEVGVPYLGDLLPARLMSALAGLSAGGAFVARLIAQKEFEDENET